MSATAPDILDQLIASTESRAAAPKLVNSNGVVQRIAKTNYTHDGMIDLILADPGISQNELALRLGYTASWISSIMVSDAFQAALAARREQIIDPMLRATTKQRLEGMLSRSMAILEEKLSADAKDVPDQLALRALELSGRLAGYGAKAEEARSPANSSLDELGKNLVGLLATQRAAQLSEPINVTPVER